MPSARLRELRRALSAAADPVRSRSLARYFKTGQGEHGEGDRFLGLTLPQVRALARTARDLSLADVLALLHSKWHEERTLALMALVERHRTGGDEQRGEILRAYLANTRYVNNWDLVDLSARDIVGAHIPHDGTKHIERLARSKSLWERRIAMIATFHTIARDDFGPTFRIAEQLLDDEQDLIHKAVGWALREVGKRDASALRGFLRKHAATMPRTALRYSIERFEPAERKRWLSKGSE